MKRYILTLILAVMFLVAANVRAELLSPTFIHWGFHDVGPSISHGLLNPHLQLTAVDGNGGVDFKITLSGITETKAIQFANDDWNNAENFFVDTGGVFGGERRNNTGSNPAIQSDFVHSHSWLSNASFGMLPGMTNKSAFSWVGEVDNGVWEFGFFLAYSDSNTGNWDSFVDAALGNMFNVGIGLNSTPAGFASGRFMTGDAIVPAVVPAPATLAVVALGLAGLGYVRARRKK